VGWCSGKALKDGQTGVIMPIYQKATGVNTSTTGASLSLDSLEKFVSSALKKNAAKYLNQSWMLPSTVFVLAVPLQTKSWEYARDVYTCLVDLEKPTMGFLVKSFEDCCGSSVLTAVLLLAVNGHQVTVFPIRSLCGSVELNHNCSPWLWVSTRMCAVTIHFHSLYELDR